MNEKKKETYLRDLVVAGRAVLREAIAAVHRSTLGRLEGNLRNLTAVAASRFVHLTGATAKAATAAATTATETATATAAESATSAISKCHFLFSTGLLTRSELGLSFREPGPSKDRDTAENYCLF